MLDVISQLRNMTKITIEYYITPTWMRQHKTKQHRQYRVLMRMWKNWDFPTRLVEM